MRHRWATSIAAATLLALPLLAQTVRPKVRIKGGIDEHRRVTLAGNRHPLARPEHEVGLAALDQRMDRIILALDADPEQQKALEELIADQRNPHAARYGQWLTPESFGRQFGIAQEDLDQVTNWLKGHGFEINEIPVGRQAIVFSGTVGQVEAAFHTQVRKYNVGGQIHYANASDPEIPRALASVVHGVVSLHDFRSRRSFTSMKPIPNLEFSTSGGLHYLAPADFATIYDLNPLYQSGIDGTGQSVAVVGRCDLQLSDVQTFRSYFGLPAKDPTIVVNGPDPGIVSLDEQAEASLDVEWASAVAKNANVQFVVSDSTLSTDGVNLSAMYIVNNNLAPVMTLSFGQCESSLGSSGNAFYNNTYQQAAAQGITVVVASGDSGAADCDPSSNSFATRGLAVNGLCSPPYGVCVGGTEFNDTSNPGLYWAAVSDAVTKGSALQYIPEAPWNDSGVTTGGTELWATGGGSSIVYPKPAWQTGAGVPADNARDVPDVSLAASTHDGFLIYLGGTLYSVGGTSASAPSFAGVMALVNQKMGGRQGNANPTLYGLAAHQQSGGAAVFHDIATGNNSVPAQTGFNATPGYDRVTGLGSMDGNVLVNHWSDSAPPPTPGIQLSLSSSSVSVVQAANANLTATVSVSGGFNSAVQLSASGLPAGVTAGFVPASFNAPGSGASTLTLTASAQATPGSYPVQITASGGGLNQNASLTVTVTPPSGFAVGLGAPSLTVGQGSSGTVGVTVTISGAFNAAVAFSATGMPTGMTAAFTPTSLPAPGSGSSTLRVTAGSQTVPGTYTLQVRGTSGAIVQSASLSVTVTGPPSFTLTSSAGSVSIAQGGQATVNLTTAVSNGFNSAITLVVSNLLPNGLTAAFAPSSFAAPGVGASVLTFTASASIFTGSYTATIMASGGGLSRSVSVTVVVTAPPTFTLTDSPSSVSIQQGKSANVNISVTATNGFSAPVGLSVSGAPTGLTAGLSISNLPAPGTGTSVLTLTAASTLSTGTRTLTITATGGGITKTLSLSVTITSVAGLSVTSAVSSVSIAQASSKTFNVTVKGTSGFNSTVTMSVTGLPTGVTATFSPSSFSGAGTHTTSLRLRVASNAPAASNIAANITATGGGATATAALSVTVVASPF